MMIATVDRQGSSDTTFQDGYRSAMADAGRIIDGLEARIKELEDEKKPISILDAPKDGSPVIVETTLRQPLLVHWSNDNGGQWVSHGAALTRISLGDKCLPIHPWPDEEDKYG